MESADIIIESLNAVGYDGRLLKGKLVEELIASGPKSENFRELVTWITYEIHVLRNTEEKLTKGADFNEFMLEICGLLKEMICPYEEFVAGPLTSRLLSKESRMLLFDYLITELMALKMGIKLKPEETSYIIPMHETTTARALESITKELNLGKPPDNISPKVLFKKIENKLDEILKKTNPKKLCRPLFESSQRLTDSQWQKLEKMHKELDKEYNLRRQMLLTRLEVTVQSFQWSENMKGREDKIVSRYQKKKKELDELQKAELNTDIPALLAARTDLAIIEKTSNANVRKNTGTKLQKHVIGRVPDRGGRAYEHAPPPPEMPSWQQNRSSGPSGGGRGGFSNRGGGGRGGQGGNQNNWSQQQQSSGQFQGNNSRGGGFNQRPQFEQRQQNQYDNRDSQWSGGNATGGNATGGGRVQGGWSQRGTNNPFQSRQSDGGYGGGGDVNSNRQQNQYNNQGSFAGQQSFGRQNYDQNDGNRNSGGYGNNDSNSSRGRSNYNRGGGRGRY